MTTIPVEIHAGSAQKGLLATGMPSNFQLPVAVTLGGAGLLSLAFRGLSERGKIALPIILDGPLESRPDPFDVTSPEDIIDGEPIDEASFWVNVSSVVRMRIVLPILS